MQMQVKVKPPKDIVIVAGIVLHEDACRVNMSRIKPLACTVDVLEHPRTPPRLVELFTGWAAAPDDQEVPELWVRVIHFMPSQLGGNVLLMPLDLEVLDCNWITKDKLASVKPTEEEASILSA